MSDVLKINVGTAASPNYVRVTRPTVKASDLPESLLPEAAKRFLKVQYTTFVRQAYKAGNDYSWDAFLKSLEK